MPSTEPGFRIGVDVGGTFTDFVLRSESGRTAIWKEDSTPADPERAILAGLDGLANEVGLSTREMLQATAIFVHGSTIATNAVIERSGSKVGLLGTAGFRDVLYFRDGFKWDRFNTTLERPEDFVPRHLRLSAEERTAADGRITVPLDEESVRVATREFMRQGVESVAIAFLWSIANDQNERQAASIVAEESDGLPVVCSADVLPEIGEWQRTSATVLSAYALPKIEAYLQRLERSLRSMGLDVPMQVMQINGGCASAEELLKRPVNGIHSGPAAAPSAASFYASQVDSRELINVDMGGTSFDVSLIRDGLPVMSREIEVERQPVGVSGVEVHSIGAGGGSIAWIDAGGALRLGPQSAGARPGPAAYGLGGTEPTVTDANIVLGYLSPDDFLGGRRRLRQDLAEEAIRRKIAEPLSLSVEEAAAGIFRLANANMADGIRYVSVERGIDPRGFTMVSGGGAGGIHACAVARSLGVKKVMIPPEAATFCAFGMTVTDVRHDYTRTARSISTNLDVDAIRSALEDMERLAFDRLREEGFDEGQIQLRRMVDARYLNQVHEITIPVPSGDITADLLAGVADTFHDEHRKQFTYEIPGAKIEYLHWRVSAVGNTEATQSRPAATAEGTPPSPQLERPAFVDGEGSPAMTRVYDAESIKESMSVTGPAIVVSPVTTLVIGRGEALSRHRSGALLVDIAAAGRTDV